jgi:hypothetical protein
MGMTMLVTLGYEKARRVFKSMTAPTAPPAMTLPRKPVERPGWISALAPASNPPLQLTKIGSVVLGRVKRAGVSKLKAMPPTVALHELFKTTRVQSVRTVNVWFESLKMDAHPPSMTMAGPMKRL